MNINIAYVTQFNYPKFTALPNIPKEKICKTFIPGDIVVDTKNKRIDIVLGCIGAYEMRTLEGVRSIDEFRIADEYDISLYPACASLLKGIKNAELENTHVNYDEYMFDTHFYGTWHETAIMANNYLYNTARGPVSDADYAHMKDMFVLYYTAMKIEYPNIKKIDLKVCELYEAFTSNKFSVITVDDIWTFITEVWG